MSNRRRPESYLDTLTDRQLPGGCDDCAAYQVVAQHSPGVYVLTVHHDGTCPYYRSRSTAEAS